jgi:hypothetical protein
MRVFSSEWVRWPARVLVAFLFALPGADSLHAQRTAPATRSAPEQRTAPPVTPTVESVSPRALTAGRSYDLVVSGRGLAAGMALSFGAGIDVVSRAVAVSDAAVRISVRVRPDAAPGPRSVILAERPISRPLVMVTAAVAPRAAQPDARAARPVPETQRTVPPQRPAPPERAVTQAPPSRTAAPPSRSDATPSRNDAAPARLPRIALGTTALNPNGLSEKRLNGTLRFLASKPSRITLREWDGKATVDNVKYYVAGPVQVNWHKTVINWTFEWETKAQDLKAVEWQVSFMPFPPAEGRSDTAPTGLLGKGNVSGVPKPGGKSAFNIVLSKWAPRPPDWAGAFASSQSQGNVSAKPAVPQSQSGKARQARPVPGSPQSSPAKPDLFPEGTGKPPSPAAASAQIFSPLFTNLYVRLVPVGADGKQSGTASNTVILEFGDPPKPAGPDFSADAIKLPKVSLQGASGLRPEASDVMCWMVATQDIKIGPSVVYKKGAKNNVCAPRDEAWYEEIADVFESFAGLISGAVNYVSKVYNNAKAKLVSSVSGAIGCCAAVIDLAVNAGLAAVGMPPSLPNFDQLVAGAQGDLEDYLAQQIVNAAPVPVPPELAKKAVHELIETSKGALKDGGSGGGGTPQWIPDPQRQYRPFVMTLKITNPHGVPSPAVLMKITEASGHFLTKQIQVPKLAPGASMSLPIAMTPKDDPAHWRTLMPDSDDLSAWMSQYGMNTAKVLEQYNKATQQAQAALKQWSAEYGDQMRTFTVTLNPGSPWDYAGLTKQCMPKTGCLVDSK